MKRSKVRTSFLILPLMLLGGCDINPVDILNTSLGTFFNALATGLAKELLEQNAGQEGTANTGNGQDSSMD